MRNPELDPVIHQPVRTKIVALLVREGDADYSSIKKAFNLSDGHMSTHMKALSEAEYVESIKTFENNKPKTSYKLTPLGKRKFTEYIKQLKQLVDLG